MRLPIVTSSTMCSFRSALGMEEGSRERKGASPGNDETERSCSEGVSVSSESKPGRLSASIRPGSSVMGLIAM